MKIKIKHILRCYQSGMSICSISSSILIAYYEAVPSQKKEYHIQACENVFHYFGGVPNAIVPDNLKSTDAILDRIAHTAHKIELTGDSVRKINAIKK